MNVSSPSEDLVGVCPIAPFVTSTSDGLPYTEIFYVGNRPILVVTKPTRQDHQSEKLVTQISHANDANALRRFAYATESYFTLGQLMQRALTPVFEILSRGLYVVHVERMIPTDGAGNFFLNAYSVRREIRGTAEINSVIGATKNYAAPFLIPTQTISQYSEQKYTRIQQLTRSGKYIGGLAYHVSGLFCALLEGHHAAMASVMEDKPFNCLVIEPVRSVIYEDEELTKASGQTPRITALSCPNVKIPLNILPHDMLEDFLTTRHESRPEQYEKIKGKLRRNLRNIARRRYEPEIYDKVRFYPNVAMIESASS
ncbi:MAG: hypothetical protein LBN42_00925, partial [Oscillospiraceae bacterium]|nr:hypothetical protein [Oscillospiraceae bacterium]